MSAHDEAVEEAEARQVEQIDEQRLAEAEGWLREYWLKHLAAFCSAGQFRVELSVEWLMRDVGYHRDEDPRLSAAYDVLGLSGVLRALARFVEEEDRTR